MHPLPDTAHLVLWTGSVEVSSCCYCPLWLNLVAALNSRPFTAPRGDAGQRRHLRQFSPIYINDWLVINQAISV